MPTWDERSTPDAEHRSRACELDRELASLTPEAIDALPPETMRGMIRELQAEQVAHAKIEVRRQEIESKFQTLFEMSPIGVAYHEMIYDAAGAPFDYRFLEVNAAFIELTGVDPRGRTARDAFPGIESDPFDWIGTYGRVARTGETIRFEQYFQVNDRWYDCVAFQNRQDQFVVTFHEMTGFKRAEKELKDSKALVDAVVEHVPLMMFLKEATDLRFVVFNRAGEELLGHDRSSLIGKNDRDFFTPEQADFFMARDREVLSGAVDILDIPEEPILTGAKGTRLLHTRKVCIRGEDGTAKYLLGISEDITERKRAESALRESERRYRELFDRMSSGVAVYEAVADGEDFIIRDLNPAAERIENIRRDDLLGMRLTEAFPGARAYGISAALRRVWRSGAPEYLPDKYYQDEWHPEGWRENWIFRLPTGEVVAIYNDITARKRAEAELKESERRFRTLFENAGIGAALVESHTGNFLKVNRRYADFAGYSIEEMERLSFQAITHPEDVGQNLDFIARLLRGTGSEFAMEKRYLRKDGEQVWGRLTISPLGPPGEPFSQHIALVEDITERKRAEAERVRLEGQLQQAQRMESVGRLAGGVAHDFNNMLGVILGHAEMALEQADPARPLHAALLEIQKAAGRSADVARQLLAFARKQTVAPVVLDPNAAIAGMIRMLQRLIGENVELVWRQAAQPWQVRMDPTQFDQILANLCVNARDAIDDVGRVTIETGNSVFTEEDCARYAEFVPGEYVRLAVSDTGCGMDKETLAHIFEPFFTTKGLGEGTGLGLATVYGAVRQNDGFIHVESVPGSGTTFTIYLPRHADAAGTVRAEGAAAPIRRGEETILLVEDEAALLAMTAQMLEKQGYAVLRAESPGEAIRLAREHAGSIHLLMTDVIMPDMNGRNLTQYLLALYPHLRCLFMSGYTAEIIAHQGVLDNGVDFIQKPFTMRSLSAKVREVLDRGSAAGDKARAW